ncbi:LysM peptidoglycan-binding domain-containing M23 family metallopeptidase [Gloeocapsopsis dulcis]|uniref:Peptidase n=1 Tax=Gloeocapsopsis dulcis AAB1 = 1H9 TaxID=1433147 RepID=A0A6N8FRI4_9CHRO|nr:M23 family metallopeptidase [Gloeocapsopsis dulcis]MUL35202.1 peptidase [Gloeocapsopsis dulcis AAB1 = 1H9]WNN89088.1 M23 family metallopeptidase [Gloeocapsopsis dulcis]
MTLRYSTLLSALPLGLLLFISPQGHSASTNDASETARVCPQPALSRLTRHKVAPGETLDSIAQKYNLISATLIGINPALRTGQIAVGSEIIIPPFNGIRVEVPSNQSWQQIATKYKVRADVLFEANGCQPVSQFVFVPGVNWSPEAPSTSASSQFTEYPLPTKATVAMGYGWQINPNTGQVFFHSGVDLLAPTGTAVRAVSAGTVAFAGEQGSYGNLVVVNHQEGRQTRYAHLQKVSVTTGQIVQPGQVLGTVGITGNPTSTEPHLHFEVRYNSALGWVAEEPTL